MVNRRGDFRCRICAALHRSGKLSLEEYEKTKIWIAGSGEGRREAGGRGERGC